MSEFLQNHRVMWDLAKPLSLTWVLSSDFGWGDQRRDQMSQLPSPASQQDARWAREASPCTAPCCANQMLQHEDVVCNPCWPEHCRNLRTAQVLGTSLALHGEELVTFNFPLCQRGEEINVNILEQSAHVGTDHSCTPWVIFQGFHSDRFLISNSFSFRLVSAGTAPGTEDPAARHWHE